ncbi:MAG: SDR family oxidoreductase [Nitrospirae bacterium]|nr:SDR family oxidoreductase [Nitrospirota bacterium]MBF0554104.1 SDR family oxidoreductase [Nitrospirota bacterium]
MAEFLKAHFPNSRILLTTRNLSKPLPDWASNFDVLHMDLCDSVSISNCLFNRNVDTIIQLAAINEVDCMTNTELAMEINGKGTLRLLNLAVEYGVRRFIYFSTFHVYGDTQDYVISESTLPKPSNHYAITHRLAEDYVLYYSAYHNIEGLVFRLSNGFGYPMDININRWTLVFNDFCRQATTTGRIVLKSSGKQQRDFITLTDISRAVYHFLTAANSNGLFNLGGNLTMSILDVANKVAEIYQKKYETSIKSIEVSNRKEKPQVPFVYSVEKLLSTGFVHRGDIDHEIIKTLDVCEEFKRDK